MSEISCNPISHSLFRWELSEEAECRAPGEDAFCEALPVDDSHDRPQGLVERFLSFLRPSKDLGFQAWRGPWVLFFLGITKTGKIEVIDHERIVQRYQRLIKTLGQAEQFFKEHWPKLEAAYAQQMQSLNSVLAEIERIRGVKPESTTMKMEVLNQGLASPPEAFLTKLREAMERKLGQWEGFHREYSRPENLNRYYEQYIGELIGDYLDPLERQMSGIEHKREWIIGEAASAKAKLDEVLSGLTQIQGHPDFKKLELSLRFSASNLNNLRYMVLTIEKQLLEVRASIQELQLALLGYTEDLRKESSSLDADRLDPEDRDSDDPDDPGPSASAPNTNRIEVVELTSGEVVPKAKGSAWVIIDGKKFELQDRLLQEASYGPFKSAQEALKALGLVGRYDPEIFVARSSDSEVWAKGLSGLVQKQPAVPRWLAVLRLSLSFFSAPKTFEVPSSWPVLRGEAAYRSLETPFRASESFRFAPAVRPVLPIP